MMILTKLNRRMWTPALTLILTLANLTPGRADERCDPYRPVQPGTRTIGAVQMIQPLPARPGDLATEAAPLPAPPTLPIPLPGVTDTVLDGAVNTVESNQMVGYNMRIKSSLTTLADYLRIRYNFNKTNQQYQPVQIVKYANIGVYNAPFFAKNVPAGVTMTLGNQTMSMGYSYYVTSTAATVFKMNLVSGQDISFNFDGQTDDYRLKVINPYGEIIYTMTATRQTGIITNDIPILANGVHTIKLEPVTKSSVSMYVRFLNANRTTLAVKGNGASIYYSFSSNLCDYAKVAFDLKQGDKLSVSAPANSRIEFVLLNGRNAMLVDNIGLPILFETPTTGRYYLFIRDYMGWGASYSGRVTITR